MKSTSPERLVLVLLASVSLGAVSCLSPTSTSSQAGGAGGQDSAKGGSGGGEGGSGAGGSGGNSGGSTGSSGGAAGGSAAGGSSGGSGGSAVGGSGGSASGGRGGGSGGTNAGGSSGGAGGSGGSSEGSGGRSGGGGGSAGAGGVGGRGGSGGGSGGSSADASAGGARTDGGRADAVGTGGRDAATSRDQAETSADCEGDLVLCGSECVDINTDLNHCGSCSRACGAGQTCSAGVCVEGGGEGIDGCSNDLASNLTLKQIAVYQSVKIPIMDNGTEVAVASRNARVVQGRETMFRVFVTLGSGWSARELSARVTLNGADGQTAQYYSKKTLSASSTDSDLKTTFNISVPASAMTASLRYAIQVVECTSSSGSTGTASFPRSGDADLGVKTTGGLKIHIIPIKVGTFSPDTSEATLAGYVEYMGAMYPVDEVTMTVSSDSLSVTTPLDWSGMLDKVRAKRQSDKPAADVYYFGLVKPAETMRAYCGSGCTTGIAYVVSSATGTMAGSSRAGVGVAFADDYSHTTMAHEIGHNHGRSHAPCAPRGSSMTGIDPKYPYEGGVIGVWGYDASKQTLFDPTKATDIMGYCSNQWISDYTYEGLATRVAAVNGVTMIYTPATALSRWRILLADDRGPRWGIPIAEEVAPEGEPETATIYDSTGLALTTVVVYRTEISDGFGSMLMVPEPQPGWHAVAVPGAPALAF
ncbi:MAG: hypothetical protein JXP73_19410 [Deltaproteobacteria bacterium]|nr:hypothetical protein [Deltaproteobacteria bacterium]